MPAKEAGETGQRPDVRAQELRDENNGTWLELLRTFNGL
jgi:hypothetical protein